MKRLSQVSQMRAFVLPERSSVAYVDIFLTAVHDNVLRYLLLVRSIRLQAQKVQHKRLWTCVQAC